MSFPEMGYHVGIFLSRRVLSGYLVSRTVPSVTVPGLLTVPRAQASNTLGRVSLARPAQLSTVCMTVLVSPAQAILRLASDFYFNSCHLPTLAWSFSWQAGRMAGQYSAILSPLSTLSGPGAGWSTAWSPPSSIHGSRMSPRLVTRRHIISQCGHALVWPV